MPSSAFTVTKPVEFPAYRSLTAHVVGGLNGVLRVVALLHSRRYAVRDLAVEVHEGVVESRVGCTVLLTEAECLLLLRRLRRMPAVIAAEKS